jgi:anti-anti-sigma factor
MMYSRSARATVTVLVEIDIAACRPAGCRTWSAGGLPVVSLPAEVDVANEHLLRSTLLEVCTGDSVVVVDMSITTHLAAAGVGMLYVIGSRLQAGGGELLLVAEDAQVQRVLDVLEVDQLFPIFTNLPEALASDRRHALSYDQAA